MPHIIVRGRSQPDDAAERAEQQRRQLHESGWDTDRAVREMRKTLREDEQGRKTVDLRR